MSTESNRRWRSADARRREAAKLVAAVASGEMNAEEAAKKVAASWRSSRLAAMVAVVGFPAGGAAADATEAILGLLARDRV